MTRHAFVFVPVALGMVALAALGTRETRAQSRSGRTAWGDPDLQGVWSSATITPLERPVALGDKAFLSAEEAAAAEARVAGAGESAPRTGDPGTYNRFWTDSGTRVVNTRRTSLVIEPANGRVPLTPLAERLRSEDLARNADSWEYMSVWDRCVTRGVPAGMLPAGYNNAYRIVQAPGYVAIHYEMIHEVRIVPLDGRPHLPAAITQWNGDSRGRWEGNTLVVEVTNYNGRSAISTSAAGGRIKGIHQTTNARIEERFTRTAPNVITYQVRITDPEMYTAPWTVEIPLTQERDYTLYEYACHEGNTAVANILSGGRAAERAKGGGATRQ
ncbi:MAG: hypothetical protein AB7O32_19065 [Vicinamibacterales bacterium]